MNAADFITAYTEWTSTALENACKHPGDVTISSATHSDGSFVLLATLNAADRVWVRANLEKPLALAVRAVGVQNSLDADFFVVDSVPMTLSPGGAGFDKFINKLRQNRLHAGF